MGGEKAAAMPPEKGPNLFGVGLWNFQGRNVGCGKKGELAFGVRGRQGIQARSDFKEEHEPVRLSFITVFADQAGQMQVIRAQLQADFLGGFAAGADVGRFAGGHVQLAAAGAPEAAVGLAPALQQ